MENECEALPGVAYPGVRENHSTLNTKTGCDDDDDGCPFDAVWTSNWRAVVSLRRVQVGA